MGCKGDCWDTYNATRRGITSEYEQTIDTARNTRNTALANARGGNTQIPDNRNSSNNSTRSDQNNSLREVDVNLSEQLRANKLEQFHVRDEAKSAVWGIFEDFRNGEITEEQKEAQTQAVATEYQAAIAILEDAADALKKAAEDAGKVIDDGADDEVTDNNDGYRTQEEINEQAEHDAQEAWIGAQSDALETRDSEREAAKAVWESCRSGCTD